MMRKHWIVSSILLTAVAGLLSFYTSCSDVRLKNGEYALYKPNNANLTFCSTKSDEIKSNLKFIFIVDRSGSNQTRYDSNNNPLPGTDPLGLRRFEAIKLFVNGFQSDPFVYWSMINFNTQVLGSEFQDFTNDKTAFYNFVQDQQTRTASIDAGWTNYQAALDRAIQMIQDDVDAARNQIPIVASNYVIFFVSDGEPIVNGDLQDANNIINKVGQITAFEEDEKQFVEGVQVNTAYYFENPVAPGARDLLNNMSIEGNGDFLEFAAGQNIDFSRFSIPVRISKFDVKEIWVHNTMTTWYENILQEDSDGDGLSDDQERLLGSNHRAYDSDGNGVGDGVEYRISGGVAPCRDATCDPAQADPFTSCRSVELPPGSSTLYGDRDNDYLNDCEEKLLDSDMNDPDSNKDYIPDDFAFKNGIKMNETSNAAYLDPDFDGLTDYQELKYNTPVRIANDQVPGHKQLRYTGRLVTSDFEQDCYEFRIDDLVTRSNDDIIRVYIMENTKTLNEKRLMRSTERSIRDGLVFSNADFN